MFRFVRASGGFESHAQNPLIASIFDITEPEGVSRQLLLGSSAVMLSIIVISSHTLYMRNANIR